MQDTFLDFFIQGYERTLQTPIILAKLDLFSPFQRLVQAKYKTWAFNAIFYIEVTKVWI